MISSVENLRHLEAVADFQQISSDVHLRRPQPSVGDVRKRLLPIVAYPSNHCCQIIGPSIGQRVGA